MSYYFKIGELNVTFDNSVENPHIRLGTARQKRDDAPAFGDRFDYCNELNVAYPAWKGFCKNVGLYELFYGDGKNDCLLENHPGCVPLTTRHQSKINEVFKENPTFELLIWLNYWVNWAMENCDKPVFENN